MSTSFKKLLSTAALLAVLFTTNALAADADPQWSAKAQSMGLAQVHVASDGTVSAGPSTKLEQIILDGQVVMTARGVAPQPKVAGPVVIVCHQTSTGGQPFCIQASAFQVARLVQGWSDVTFPSNPELGIRGATDTIPDLGRVTARGPGATGYWASYSPLGLVSANLATQVDGGCRLTMVSAEAATFVAQTAATVRPATESCDFVLSLVGGGGLGNVDTAIVRWELNTETTIWTPVFAPGQTLTCTAPSSLGGTNGSICAAPNPQGGWNPVGLAGPVSSNGGTVTFTLPTGTICTLTGSTAPRDCGDVFEDGFED